MKEKIKELISIIEPLKKVNISNNPSDGTISIFMLPTSGRRYDREKFLSLVVEIAINFVLSEKTIANYLSKENYMKMSNSVREKFRTKENNSGEFGELLLYTLLEGDLNAKRVLCKYELKTNGNHYVFGSDGIHFLKVSDNSYHLIFGESKMYKELSCGLIEAFKTLDEFVKNNKINCEKELISSHIDEIELDAEEKEILSNLLIPSKTKISNNVIDAFSIFVGFNIDISKEIESCTEENFKEIIKSKINNELKNLEGSVYKKLKKRKNLFGHNFYIYLLPFDNKEEWNKKFMELISK
ncbi:HamA C-terminal domain-containing protein [Mycoplasma mycoides]|uniref:HamA C-terminal domain-containing protein n=1 Tax=Mycoplasma mycoides TaxID=2102 RepID=UPI0022405EFA|nr:DUF1837 domain-containing protein [Mycoplasma mycoides]QVK02884.1 DUF1837 domain-containing protein [Mycoplasma mycoides subsp. capri]QVK03702.1 DUF1837 domain-containing protein [Mycoplasma mycoides subsp. capri]